MSRVENSPTPASIRIGKILSVTIVISTEEADQSSAKSSANRNRHEKARILSRIRAFRTGHRRGVSVGYLPLSRICSWHLLQASFAAVKCSVALAVSLARTAFAIATISERYLTESSFHSGN